MISDNTTKPINLLLPEWHADRLELKYIKERRRWIEFTLWMKQIEVLWQSRDVFEEKDATFDRFRFNRILT